MILNLFVDSSFGLAKPFQYMLFLNSILPLDFIVDFNYPIDYLVRAPLPIKHFHSFFWNIIVVLYTQLGDWEGYICSFISLMKSKDILHYFNELVYISNHFIMHFYFEFVNIIRNRCFHNLNFLRFADQELDLDYFFMLLDYEQHELLQKYFELLNL